MRDPALPELAGQYVYGDYCLGKVYAARLSAGAAAGDHDLGLTVVEPVELRRGRLRARLRDVTRRPGVPPRASGACQAQAGTGPDATPPLVRLRVNHRQHPLRTKTVSLRVSCDEQCSVTMSGSVSVARRGHAYVVPALRLGHVSRKLAAGARVRLKLPVGKRIRAAIRKALRGRGRARATLRVTARDAAGTACGERR